MEEDEPNFNVGFNYIEEDVDFSLSGQDVISLEDNCPNSQHVLYDNVVAEDISSDENLDSM